MPQKPSVAQLDWVPANSGVRVEPSGSKKNQGWSPLEPLPAQNENWILYSLDQWQKYFERVTDGLFFKTFVLGTTQQVTDGYADYDVPQDAYDAAHAAGGGVVLILPGNIPGDLNVNQSSGILIKGSGYDSNLTGNVVISGQRNLLKDLQISGSLEIGGSYNQLDVHHTNNALTNTATALLNGYVIRRVASLIQTLQMNALANNGYVKVAFKGNLSGEIAYDADASAIETVIQAIPGLGSATVTDLGSNAFQIALPSTADQPLTFEVNTLVTVQWPQVALGIYGGPFDPALSSVQADNPSANFTIQVDFDEVTGTLQAGASTAAAVQSAFRALGMVGTYDLSSVIVTQPGGPGTLPYVITFVNNAELPYLSQSTGSVFYMGSPVSINQNTTGLNEFNSLTRSASLSEAVEPSGLFENAGADRLVNIVSSKTLTAIHNGAVLKKMKNTPVTITLPPPMKDFRFTYVDGTGFNDVNPTTFVRNLGNGKIQGLQEDFTYEVADGKIEFSCDGTDWYIV